MEKAEGRGGLKGETTPYVPKHNQRGRALIPVPDSSVQAHPRPSKYYLRSFPNASGKAVVSQLAGC
jgi:hypothetical protein